MAVSRLVKILALATILASTLLVQSAAAESPARESKVRIVRLSDVEGAVQIERAPAEGLEKAFLNLPIVEGSRLKTGKDGRAEIEFEDGSTARIGPDTDLQFTHLALGDNGQKLNGMQLTTGTFYGNLHAKNGDSYWLALGTAQEKNQQKEIGVLAPAHFRLVTSGSRHAILAVFKGKVDVRTCASQDACPKEVEVAEKHSATINLADDVAEKAPAQKDADVVIAKNYDDEPLDAWDQLQNAYHDQHASAGGSDFSSPYGYGMSDLSYYGSFSTIPGYGYAWQPYFANVAWSPFMDGAWAYYPGAGYMWVSAYPWGWMPYYYGTWAMAPGYGWIWQPGNSWNTWNTVPHVANTTAVLPTAPATGHQTVMVGRGLMANASDLPAKLTINPGSAGFGVPRGSLTRMAHYSQKLEQNSRPMTIATEQPMAARPVGIDPGLRGVAPSPAPPAPMETSTTHSVAPHVTPHP